MENPDKWIRKYFRTTLSGMIFNSKLVKVYDSHTPNNDDVLIILSTQTGSNDWNRKCSVDKNRTILIDVITRYKGNTGSRLLLDDIIEEIMLRTKNIVVENFVVNDWSISFPNEIITHTATESIFRKIIQFNLNLQ